MKVDYDQIVAKVRETEEYKTAIGNLEVKSRVMKQPKEEKMEESINIRQMREALDKQDVKLCAVHAREYAVETNAVQKAVEDPMSYTIGFKSDLQVRTSGKGLVIVGGLKTRDTLDSGSNPE